MEDKLIEILESFGHPVRKQGSLAPDEKYPESFFTFWNNDSPDSSYYDNAPHATVWDYDVNFYSSDPALVYSELANAKKKLEAEGWIVPGKGYDVVSDEVTHTGRGMRAYFSEFIQEV